MLLAHKIELDLNNRQRTHMAKACGCARFAYNWSLNEWRKMYAAWKEDHSMPKPNQYILRKRLNSIKRDQFPWMREVTKYAPQQAIINLGKAFDRFFKGLGQYPKFHRKGINDSFYIGNDQIKVDGKRLKIPSLGWVRLREKIRFSGKIMSITVSRTADRWFASFQIETPNVQRYSENQGIVGVDLGVKNLATLSDGSVFEAPKPLKSCIKKLKRLQRQLSRKEKGSRNRFKLRMKVARLYARIVNIRNDFLHKLTTWLVRTYSIIGIENLNVRGMLKNNRLAFAVSDMGFHEFRRQLEYKCKEFGSSLAVIDRWFPSSKMCSDCGYRNDELTLKDRDWICPVCGCHHDRDINAAINIRNLAASSAVSACGEESAGRESHFSGETGLCETGT